MKTVIKREFKNYMKNPILWIGLVLVIAGIYQAVGSYLDIHYFQPEEEIKNLTAEEMGDADIMDGYIRTTAEQQIALGCEKLRQVCIDELDMSEKEVDGIMEHIWNENMTIPEIAEYLVENTAWENVGGVVSTFEEFEIIKGSVEEINIYIGRKLEEHPFSFYFARKFADFAGLFMGFFASLMLAFLFIRDTRKDMYELLHTKPLSAAGFIMGKVLGGFLVIVFVIGILTLVFGGLCEYYARAAGFPVRFWDIFGAAAVYILPNILMITSVYTVIALLFKNPLPGLPLLILYMIYSNMGSIGPEGNYGYFGKPLAIMVRFPGQFFEIEPPPMVLFNQLFLIAASGLLILISITLWKRRRLY